MLIQLYLPFLAPNTHVMANHELRQRDVLISAGTIGVAGLAGCTGNNDGDTTTTNGGTGGMTSKTMTKNVSGAVKVGVLQPISGDLKYYGQQSLWGFLSGLAYKANATPKMGVKSGKTTVSVGHRRRAAGRRARRPRRSERLPRWLRVRTGGRRVSLLAVEDVHTERATGGRQPLELPRGRRRRPRTIRLRTRRPRFSRAHTHGAVVPRTAPFETRRAGLLSG